MFGLYLLYYFRVFERQIGSNKYSVFLLVHYHSVITSWDPIIGHPERYKLHQHTCIWTLWSYICLICSILSWHSDHITIPYLWPKFQRQIIHLPSWSSASFIFLEALPYSWYIWSGCWFSLSSKCVRHPQNEHSTGYFIIFCKILCPFARKYASSFQDCCWKHTVSKGPCCSESVIYWICTYGGTSRVLCCYAGLDGLWWQWR